jgi:hypothetical protein
MATDQKHEGSGRGEPEQTDASINAKQQETGTNVTPPPGAINKPPPAADPLVKDATRPRGRRALPSLRDYTLLVAVMTVLGAMIGGITSATIQHVSAHRLRRDDAQVKARDLAVNNTERMFQDIHGLRIKLRADLNVYREMAIRANYHAAKSARQSSSLERERELHCRRVVDTYTARIIDDRRQLHATLGWLEYVLPEAAHPLRRTADALLNLQSWDAPEPTKQDKNLETWRDAAIRAAREATRVELEPKFHALRSMLHIRRADW